MQPWATLLFQTHYDHRIDVIASLRAAKARHDAGETTTEQLGMEKTGILQHAHYHSEQLQQASRDSILHFARPAGHVSVFCTRCRLPGHIETHCTQTLPHMPRSTNKSAGRIYPERMSPQDTPTGLTRTEATVRLAQRWAAMSAKEKRDWARCKSAQEHHGLSAVSKFLAGDTEKFPQVPPRVAEKPTKKAKPVKTTPNPDAGPGGI